MEDLWRVEEAGIDLDLCSDNAAYRRFLKRFNQDDAIERRQNRLRNRQQHNTAATGEKP